MNSDRNLRVVVIGAGMAGILAAIKLREAGYRDLTVYEKGDDVGGTWRENTYPGLTCDTPSHNYTYSFAPNPEWTRQLPPGAEIQAYFRQVVADYRIREAIRFNEEIVHCEYRDGQWYLQTRTGQHDQADVLIAATGVLHHPSYPSLPGLETFEGACFHSARWDHSVPLDGKRIGIIGNGSTGTQLVAALVKRAQVKHFQRTAQWVMPVTNDLFTEAQRAEFLSDPQLLHDLKNDPTYMAKVRHFTTAVADAASPEAAQIEAVCATHLEQSIVDPVLREKLRPTYRAACKRLIFSPDYYQAIQQPNADLVNDGIELIEPTGVRTRDGKLHELDVLALATGFNAHLFMRPTQVIGRGGVSLDEVWAKRPSAYLSIAIPEFPNLFMLNGPTGPVGNFSLIEIAEMEWAYISQLLDLLKSGRCREISVRHEAMHAYEQRRLEKAKTTVFGSGCTSWYLDAEGVPSTWPWDYAAFEQAMACPNLEDYELACEAAPVA
ncbi:NAD(P)/FAD-dependent oxidoreductase [Pseudomonas sp. IC_126]|uniref:flavin-containing monooxygenase n=1 Tax=Pseudomonas sp. IC_126 TaxID=2547400 RepID=UPI001039144B|nr:NAD(P)/FAD-dependent oxidoreductase [Pseudomonas sp. IC_126]TCD21355.1 NAD(P)/FAD-dependent oxidoreductase [Pseudomonas sp. IC_126]